MKQSVDFLLPGVDNKTPSCAFICSIGSPELELCKSTAVKSSANASKELTGKLFL